jgi:hypothetical protein
MSTTEDARLQVITELTLHIEKLEMDNEIHIIRDNLNKETYESTDIIILNLKNILGKLIQNKKLNSDETKLLESVIKNNGLIAAL